MPLWPALRPTRPTPSSPPLAHARHTELLLCGKQASGRMALVVGPVVPRPGHTQGAPPACRRGSQVRPMGLMGLHLALRPLQGKAPQAGGVAGGTCGAPALPPPLRRLSGLRCRASSAAAAPGSGGGDSSKPQPSTPKQATPPPPPPAAAGTPSPTPSAAAPAKPFGSSLVDLIIARPLLSAAIVVGAVFLGKVGARRRVANVVGPPWKPGVHGADGGCRSESAGGWMLLHPRVPVGCWVPERDRQWRLG